MIYLPTFKQPNSLCLFKVIFVTLYHGIHRHVSPPFREYVEKGFRGSKHLLTRYSEDFVYI